MSTSPLRDPARLAAVLATGLAHAPHDDPAFDRLAHVAARLLGAPVAAVTLVDAERQLLLGQCGIAEPWASSREQPLAWSYCRHALGSAEPLVIPDAGADARTRGSAAFVEGGLQAYLGIPLRDDGGQVLGTLCVAAHAPRAWAADDVRLLADLAGSAIDRLALRRALDGEATQRARLAELLDTTDDLVCTTGPDGRIDYVNRAWSAALGYTLDEVRDVEPASLVAREHRARYLAAAHRLVAGQVIEDFEAVLVARDGRRLVCRGRGVPVMRDGRCVATRAVYRNVTAVQQADAVRARLLATFEATPDAVALFSRDGRLVFLNRAARTLTGLPDDAVLDAVRVWDLVAGETEERLAAVGIPAAQQDGSWQGDLALRRADGATVPGVGTLVAHPSTIPDDAPYFLSLVFVDLRERHEREQALRAAEAARRAEERRAARLKDEMIALVSHELRTPLGAIRGALRLLEARPAAWKAQMEPRDAELLAMASRNADRLTRLVNDLLDLERLEAGAAPMERRAVSLTDLASQALDATTAAAEAAGVRLVVDVEPEHAVVDPDRIVQVLVNLVANAIKFSPAGAPVTVEGRVATAADGASRVRLTVRDEGRGIPEDRLEAVFRRFEQVDRADATQKGGAGLGLAICRAIVEQHGGTIRAERQPRGGTAMHVDLPADPDAHARARASAPALPAGARSVHALPA